MRINLKNFQKVVDKQYYTSYSIKRKITLHRERRRKVAFKIESSLLDACALAILKRGDTYGYEITQEMKSAIVISESTLYPVLRRLQKEGLCRTYDQPYQGRNRRYYSITEKGEAQLLEYRKQWNDYKTAIEKLMVEDERGGEND